MKKTLALAVLAAPLVLAGCSAETAPEAPATPTSTYKVEVPAEYKTPVPAIPATTSLSSSDQDQLFLRTIEASGIEQSGIAEKSQLIKFGRAICKDLDDGLSFRGIVTTSSTAYTGKYSAVEVGKIGGAAVGAFCLEHADEVTGS